MNNTIKRLTPQDKALFKGLSDDETEKFFHYLFSVPKDPNGTPSLRSQVIGLYDPFCDRRKYDLGILWQSAPYSFCDHRCAYCYGRSYLQQFGGGAKVKANFRRSFDRCLVKMNTLRMPARHLSMANSTDILQHDLERQHRHVLFMLQRIRDNRNVFSTVCVLTKAPDVFLDDPVYIECLTEIGAEVQVSIAFWRDSQGWELEPGAPPVSDRRRAVEQLLDKGVQVAVRIDPLFPRDVPGCVEYQSWNEDLVPLVEWAARLGVDHVISSPLKQVYRRNRVQGFYDSLLPAYQIVRGGYRRMPEDQQAHLLSDMRQLCKDNGLSMEHCFENILKRTA